MPRSAALLLVLALLAGAASAGVLYGAASQSCATAAHRDCQIGPGMKVRRQTFCADGGASAALGEVDGVGCESLRSCCGSVRFDAQRGPTGGVVVAPGSDARYETVDGATALVVAPGKTVRLSFARRSCLGSIVYSGDGASIEMRAAGPSGAAQAHRLPTANPSSSRRWSKADFAEDNCGLASVAVTATGARKVLVSELTACSIDAPRGDCSGLCEQRCASEGLAQPASRRRDVQMAEATQAVGALTAAYETIDAPMRIFVNCSSPIPNSDLCLTTWGYENPNPYLVFANGTNNQFIPTPALVIADVYFDSGLVPQAFLTIWSCRKYEQTQASWYVATPLTYKGNVYARRAFTSRSLDDCPPELLTSLGDVASLVAGGPAPTDLLSSGNGTATTAPVVQVAARSARDAPSLPREAPAEGRRRFGRA